MVERSDRFDGVWGDGPDDDARRYPAAPLPAHERTWRHPSEVGEAHWAMSEPPVAIGRGLLVATGAIGCALGVAVLWLLVPGGLDQAPVAGPTVTRSVGAVGGAPFSTDGRTDLLTPTTVAVDPTVVLPSESVPPATVAVRSAVSDAQATAVLLEGTGMLLTTAVAVRDLRRVSLEDASATRHDAEVLAVSGDLAMLVADVDTAAPVDVLGFDEVARAAAGDEVVVLAATPIDTDFPEDGQAIELGNTVTAADVPEGTPVVDADGALVGLCTHGVLDANGDVDGVHIVPIADVLDALLDGEPSDDTPAGDIPTTPATGGPTATGTDDESATSAADVWVGVRLVELTDGRGLKVEAVTEASPAETAGIMAGDLIVEIERTPVRSVAEVRSALDGLRPGDIVAIVVAGTDGAHRTVSVVLGAAAPDV